MNQGWLGMSVSSRKSWVEFVCFFGKKKYLGSDLVHVPDFSVHYVKLWMLPLWKDFLRKKCLGRVFRRRKREHVVCQDYWERFVFETNVKPFVFQYELFMLRLLRFVFLQKETIATFGHKLNLPPPPCEILKLSNGKSVSEKEKYPLRLLKRANILFDMLNRVRNRVGTFIFDSR